MKKQLFIALALLACGSEVLPRYTGGGGGGGGTKVPPPSNPNGGGGNQGAGAKSWTLGTITLFLEENDVSNADVAATVAELIASGNLAEGGTYNAPLATLITTGTYTAPAAPSKALGRLGSEKKTQKQARRK